MATKKISKTTKSDEKTDEMDDFTNSLITSINKEFGMRVAYNLAETEAPTIVKRWLDTGSMQLNYAIKNSENGGYPEGRIIEIAGPPSIGKSHLAYHAASVTQSLGGLVVYIDTENATPVSKLKEMGIDVKRRFVYMDIHATEHVFQAIEDIIIKAKEKIKDVPILVIWDSVAATSPLAELNGEYEENTIGLQARIISKCMRKITGIIGQNNVTLLCINQIRDAIGIMYGEKTTTPGGKAIPFHASIRISLSSGSHILDKDKKPIGIHVIATIKKNKVGPPFKKCEFDIIFGKGIVENDYIFDEIRKYCDTNKILLEVDNKLCNVYIGGNGIWKEILVNDATTGEIIVTKKFYKSEFGSIWKDTLYKNYIDKVIDIVYTQTASDNIVKFEEEEESDE